MNSLKLKNYHMLTVMEAGVLSLPDWLDKLLLHGKDSRLRSRFIRTILPRIKEIYEEKKKMLESFAEKNAEGKTLFLNDKGEEVVVMPTNGKYKMTPENEDKFGKEFEAYLKEDYVIDVTEANRDEISTIGKLLTETEMKFSGKMSEYYDEWCTAFEAVFSKAPSETANQAQPVEAQQTQPTQAPTA